MANPRQRRKVRSSAHKPVKQSRRANKLLKKQPPIKGPKVLQEAWDKHKTVRQNYATLGLAHSLNPTDSGGRDITHPHRVQDRQNTEASPEQGKSGGGEKVERSDVDGEEETRDGKLPRGFGRIIRDESGTIVDVVLAEEEMCGGEEGAMDEFENRRRSEQPGRIIRDALGTGWLLGNKSDKKEGAKEMLRGVEAGGSRKARGSSSGEERYLRGLVEMHGCDYEGMSRDRKRNVNQYTAGQLERAIAKAQVGGR